MAIGNGEIAFKQNQEMRLLCMREHMLAGQCEDCKRGEHCGKCGCCDETA